MIIGIVGKIGSGKDTVAKMIQYYFACKNQKSATFPFEWYMSQKNTYCDWEVKKFAFKLKQIAAILVGCNADDFESQEFKDKLLPNEWQISDEHIKTKRTYRWLLQRFATEAIRNNIHENSWINALFADYKATKKEGGYQRIVKSNGIPVDFEYEIEYPNWIISDVRFINEALSVKQHGGIILKISRQSNKSDNHISETELEQIVPDWTIANDGTIEELYKKISDDLPGFLS